MENIIGIKFRTECISRNVPLCSLASVECFRCLMRDYPVTYSQILYPYADALSLSNVKGTEGTRLFGTHALFHGIEPEVLKCAAEYGIKSATEQLQLNSGDITDDFFVDIVEFELIDGNVAAGDIREFLKCPSDMVTAGDFGAMLSGFMPHWKLREAARVFASFVEMAYRKSGGAACGLLGGKLAINGDCGCLDEINDIFYQKTGER